MNQRSITLAILLIIAIPAAILFGQWSATDPVMAAAVAVSIIALIVVFVMGTRIWLLIPLTLAFTGTFTLLPGNFALKDIIMGFASAVMIAHWMVKRFPIKLHFGAMEALLLVQMLMLGLAYVRNPVGVMVLGGSTVGGKPYFEIAVACLTYLMLSGLIVRKEDVRKMVVLWLVGWLLAGIYETVVGFIPALAVGASQIYLGKTVGISAASSLNTNTGGHDSGRSTFLALFPRPIMTFLLGFNKPLQLLRLNRPIVFLAALFAVGCMLLSGFRSGIIGMGCLVIAAAYLHRSMIQVVIMSLIGLPMLVALIAMQGSVVELPAPAQRALSFLPGDWDPAIVAEAQGSVDWRVEMWKEALTSERYIRNKWLGDGFGYSADELAYQMDLRMRQVTPEEMQEFFLVVGSYHSGPVETIKRTGYIGLFFLLVAMIVMLVHAKKLVDSTRGTYYYPYAVIVALPFIVLPFIFVFIFGAYQDAMMQMFVGAGMMRLIQNSMTKTRFDNLETN